MSDLASAVIWTRNFDAWPEVAMVEIWGNRLWIYFESIAK